MCVCGNFFFIYISAISRPQNLCRLIFKKYLLKMQPKLTCARAKKLNETKNELTATQTDRACAVHVRVHLIGDIVDNVFKPQWFFCFYCQVDSHIIRAAYVYIINKYILIQPSTGCRHFLRSKYIQQQKKKRTHIASILFHLQCGIFMKPFIYT